MSGSRLRLHREITPSRFAELGRPIGVFECPEQRLVGITGAFDLLYYPGRALYGGHRLRYRLVVYDEATLRPVAHFDGARRPINDVAFHPTRPLTLLATGSYDGGYCFDGDLICWDRESDESWPVFAEDREVVRCRFDDDGGAVILMRPPTEESVEKGDDPFDTYFGGSVADLRHFESLGLQRNTLDPRLAGLRKVRPEGLGFQPQPPPGSALRRLTDADSGYEVRDRIWDILLSDGLLHAVHDACVVEAWNPAGHRVLSITSVPGLDAPERAPDQVALPGPRPPHGLQLLHAKGHVLVNVSRGDGSPTMRRLSSLHRLKDEALDVLCELPASFIFSVNARGQLLARYGTDFFSPTQHEDMLLDHDGRLLASLRLGHYDAFNHYLRVDGADAHYFLRGDPRAELGNKVLVELDANGRDTVLFPWDDGGRHLLCGSAYKLADGFVRAYEVHDSDPRSCDTRIERLTMSGKSRWQYAAAAVITALAPLQDRFCVFARTDGHLGLLDVATGEALQDESQSLDGFDTIVTALAVHGTRVFAGTIDGRLLEYALEGS